jgi:hypothetical protein
MAHSFKITLDGRGVYTPRIPPRGPVKDNPNALIKMLPVIEAIEKWAVEYEQKYTIDYPVGKMVPEVSIGAIRAGAPYKPSTTPRGCSIYVDVRVPPPLSFSQVEKELKQVVNAVGLGGTVECFMARKGYEGKNVEPLVDAIRAAHVAIRGNQPPPVDTAETSMWRDINIFNEVGILPRPLVFPGKMLQMLRRDSSKSMIRRLREDVCTPWSRWISAKSLQTEYPDSIAST